MVHLTMWAEPPNLLSTPSDEVAGEWTALLLRGCRVHPWVLFSGGSRGGARGPRPLFLDQTKETLVPSLLISRSGSGIVIYHPNSYNTSPILSLFAVMAGQRRGGINWNTFYFSKYINSHDSFYWQIFHEPLTLDIFMHIKAHFLRLTPVQKNISWVFLHLGDNY